MVLETLIAEIAQRVAAAVVAQLGASDRSRFPSGSTHGGRLSTSGSIGTRSGSWLRNERSPLSRTAGDASCSSGAQISTNGAESGGRTAHVAQLPPPLREGARHVG